MGIHGAVDVIGSEGAAGWAYDTGGSNPLVVHAMLNQEVIGEARADDFRSDLAAIGMGDGCCGYQVTFVRPIDQLYLPFVSVRPGDGDVELPRYAPTGFVEFFTAAYRAFPAAGRPRSVHGGLWTDRTDAAALLRGRAAIGQIEEAVAQRLLTLIHEGLVVLDAIARRNLRGIGEGEPAEVAAAVISAAAVRGVLDAVLEDRSVVVSGGSIGAEDTRLTQPSAESALPSPNECLAVIASLGMEPLQLDVVRESHRFPEFTPGGLSRWVQADVGRSAELPAMQTGLLDRYALAPGFIAVIGPGMLHAIRASSGASGCRLLVAPARCVPAEFALAARSERNADGVRLFLE